MYRTTTDKLRCNACSPRDDHRVCTNLLCSSSARTKTGTMACQPPPAVCTTRPGASSEPRSGLTACARRARVRGWRQSRNYSPFLFGTSSARPSTVERILLRAQFLPCSDAMEKQALERPRVLPKLHSQPPTYAVPWTTSYPMFPRAARRSTATPHSLPPAYGASFSPLSVSRPSTVPNVPFGTFFDMSTSTRPPPACSRSRTCAYQTLRLPAPGRAPR